jgi:hypothetical protein
VRVFNTAAVLPGLPQLCQNGGLSVLSSIGETEKFDGWERTAMLLFVKKFPVEKESVR